MAEMKFLGEHHLPLLLADHCNKFFRSIFPDLVLQRILSVGVPKLLQY
jgi:hypothetical protein